MSRKRIKRRKNKTVGLSAGARDVFQVLIMNSLRDKVGFLSLEEIDKLYADRGDKRNEITSNLVGNEFCVLAAIREFIWAKRPFTLKELQGVCSFNGDRQQHISEIIKHIDYLEKNDVIKLRMQCDGKYTYTILKEFDFFGIEDLPVLNSVNEARGFLSLLKVDPAHNLHEYYFDALHEKYGDLIDFAIETLRIEKFNTYIDGPDYRTLHTNW